MKSQFPHQRRAEQLIQPEPDQRGFHYQGG
jgi:hypothetical protein